MKKVEIEALNRRNIEIGLAFKGFDRPEFHESFDHYAAEPMDKLTVVIIHSGRALGLSKSACKRAAWWMQEIPADAWRQGVPFLKSSTEDLAEDSRVSLKTIERTVAELIRVGFVFRVAEHRDVAGAVDWLSFAPFGARIDEITSIAQEAYTSYAAERQALHDARNEKRRAERRMKRIGAESC